jgi:sugar phosphate isomerase/epimerase
MTKSLPPRRDNPIMSGMRKVFLSVLAVCVAAAFTARGENSIPKSCKISGFAIGCQAYTFNRFTAFEAIEKTAEAGGKCIEFYPNQKFSPDQPEVKLDHNLSADNIKKLKAKLKKHNIRAVNYGVVAGKNPEDWRKIFEFAKTMGLYGITTEAVGDLDLIETFVKKYDIHVGIHEHAKRQGDPNYKVWDPNYVLSVVKDRDPRIGACADTGHWQTSGLDPLEGIKILKGRVISCHLKDKTEKGHEGHDIPYGSGGGRIKEILDELKAQGFKGNISVEYEYNWLHSVPDVKQCIDFVKAYGKK